MVDEESSWQYKSWFTELFIIQCIYYTHWIINNLVNHEFNKICMIGFKHGFLTITLI